MHSLDKIIASIDHSHSHPKKNPKTTLSVQNVETRLYFMCLKMMMLRFTLRYCIRRKMDLIQPSIEVIESR